MLRSFIPVFGSFGSSAAHWADFLTDSSTRLQKRRTGTRHAGCFMLSCSIHAVLIVLCMKTNWITTVHNRLEKTTPITIIPRQKPDTHFTFEKPNLQKHEEFRMQAIGRPDDKPPGYRDERLPKIESPYALPVINFTPDIRLRADVNLSGVATLDRSLLNAPQGRSNAIGGQFYGMGGAGFSGSFGRHMRGVREMGLDVVFIFDATSSMAQFLSPGEDENSEPGHDL